MIVFYLFIIDFEDIPLICFVFYCFDLMEYYISNVFYFFFFMFFSSVSFRIVSLYQMYGQYEHRLFVWYSAFFFTNYYYKTERNVHIYSLCFKFFCIKYVLNCYKLSRYNYKNSRQVFRQYVLFIALKSLLRAC